MALSKIQSESINLADTFAFTGTVSGIASGVKQTVVHQETNVGATFVSSGTAYCLMSATNASDSTSKMEVTITPSSASAKILISVHCIFEGNAAAHDTVWTLYRNTSTRLGQPDDSNRRGGIATTATALDGNNDSTMESTNFIFVDEPNSTSATTYTLAFSNSTSMTVYLNRTIAYGDSSGIERGISTIVAQELG